MLNDSKDPTIKIISFLTHWTDSLSVRFLTNAWLCKLFWTMAYFKNIQADSSSCDGIMCWWSNMFRPNFHIIFAIGRPMLYNFVASTLQFLQYFFLLDIYFLMGLLLGLRMGHKPFKVAWPISRHQRVTSNCIGST